MSADDQIPGFTAEQAWVINTIAEKAATKAADKAVAALTTRPCPFACEDMTDVKETLYGADGIKSRVTTLEEQVANLVWLSRSALGAAIVAAVAAIASLVLKG